MSTKGTETVIKEIAGELAGAWLSGNSWAKDPKNSNYYDEYEAASHVFALAEKAMPAEAYEQRIEHMARTLKDTAKFFEELSDLDFSTNNKLYFMAKSIASKLREVANESD